jgi:hypothetical protein
VAPSAVLKSGAVPSKLSRPERGTVVGIVIPPDVRLAGEALRERELTSDRHRQKNLLTEEPSCEAEDMTAPTSAQRWKITLDRRASSRHDGFGNRVCDEVLELA